MRSPRLPIVFVVSVIVFTSTLAESQLFKPQMKVPNAEALSQARSKCLRLFERLAKGETEELAKWIVDQVGYTDSASEKLKSLNNFKLQLDLLLVSPPGNAFGKLDGYDLIDESYLPGSDRYFRMVYISYHEGAPVVWEFRFYVKPDNQVALNSIQWTPDNPFKFMSQNEMLLPIWHSQR